MNLKFIVVAVLIALLCFDEINAKKKKQNKKNLPKNNKEKKLNKNENILEEQKSKKLKKSENFKKSEKLENLKNFEKNQKQKSELNLIGIKTPEKIDNNKLTQDEQQIIDKLVNGKNAQEKQFEKRAASLLLPRSLSPIIQQKRALSLDLGLNEQIKKQNNEEEIEEEEEEENKNNEINKKIINEQKQNFCPRTSTPKVVCTLENYSSLLSETINSAVKECSYIIDYSGHLKADEIEKFKKADIKIYSSTKLIKYKLAEFYKLKNANIKNSNLGKKRGSSTRIELIETITKKQKNARIYDGFVLDLTEGFEEFDKLAEFVRDFLLSLHSEKASNIKKTPRRIIAIQLDNSSNFLSTKKTEKLFESLKYVDFIFPLEENKQLSLSKWLLSKNVNCQKIVPRILDVGKGACAKHGVEANDTQQLRQKREIYTSTIRVKTSPARLAILKEKRHDKPHTSWFENEEDEHNFDSTTHFGHYNPSQQYYPRGQHFQASFYNGQQYPYPPQQQQSPQSSFYLHHNINYGSPQWQQSVNKGNFGFDQNEYGHFENEHYEHFPRMNNKRKKTKIVMNINHNERQNTRKEEKHSRETVRNNLKSEIIGENEEEKSEEKMKEAEEEKSEEKIKEAEKEKNTKKESERKEIKKEKLKPDVEIEKNKNSDKTEINKKGKKSEKKSEEKEIKKSEKKEIEKESEQKNEENDKNKKIININVPAQENFEISHEFDFDEGDIDIEINYAVENLGGVALPLIKWQIKNSSCKLTTNMNINVANKAIANLN